MTNPRMKRKNLYLAGAWIGAPLLALAVIFNPAPAPFALGLAMLALIAAAALSTAWFHALDEVAQRAHYEAWFWGGNAGVLLLPLAVVVGAFTGWGGGEQINRWVASLGIGADAHAGFMAGIFAVLIPMMLGYSLWWVWFWVRNR